MKFNSLVFLEFLALFLLGWSVLRKRKDWALVYLVGASWLFYGYVAWWFVPLLVGTATLDWFLALAMDRFPIQKRLLLVASIVSNLGVLFVFKYLAFCIATSNQWVHTQWAIPHLILPVGISFYTFQSLSYVIDVYRGETPPTKRWIEFLAVVSLFAHLIAGPIVRVSNILPQIQALKSPTKDELWLGLDLICIGFFKKMFLADRLGGLVDLVYRGSQPGLFYGILGTVAFAFEIYYDFSGYTDIARGVARWLGLDFGINFNHPYSAIGMRDFWERWHISLTSWVRDYLYVPLGGNRYGLARSLANLWVCFLLSGLWHGANWTFVLWGGYHALMLTFERLTHWPSKLQKSPIGMVVGLILTFGITSVGWVFFRAESVDHAIRIFSSMSTIQHLPGMRSSQNLVAISLTGLCLAYEFANFARSKNWIQIQTMSPLMCAVRNGVLLGLCIVAPGSTRAFIYFQF